MERILILDVNDKILCPKLNFIFFENKETYEYLLWIEESKVVLCASGWIREHAILKVLTAISEGLFSHATNTSTCFNVHFLRGHFLKKIFSINVQFSAIFERKRPTWWGSFHFSSLRYFRIRESNRQRVPTVKDVEKVSKIISWTWFIKLILHQIDGYPRYRGRMENCDVIAWKIRK